MSTGFNIPRIADTVAEEQVAKMVHDDGTEVGDVEVVEPVGPKVHKDRTERKMSFLRSSGGCEMKRTARYKFPRQVLRDMDEIEKAVKEMTDMGEMAAEDGNDALNSLVDEMKKVEKSIQFASNDKRWRYPESLRDAMGDLDSDFQEFMMDPDDDTYIEQAQGSLKELQREMKNLEKTIGFFFRGSVEEKLASELVKVRKDLMAADTFKCPDCGSKVLDQTKYCVKCKKKVKKASSIIHVVDMLRDEGLNVKGVTRNVVKFRNPSDVDFGMSVLEESGIRFRPKGRNMLMISSEKPVKSVTAAKRFTLILRDDDFRNKAMWTSILEDMGVPTGEEANWSEPDEVELKVVGGKVY